MSDDAANRQWEARFRAYQFAVLAFNAASATLILNLAAELVPTEEEIATEETAHAAVVVARRGLWALYDHAPAKRNRAEAESQDVSTMGTF